MKILVICQHYYPEPFRITDICEELVKRGHEVFVVTGIPNYPMGEVYSGYENKKRRNEVINGVKIHRCYTVPRKTGIIKRVLNYYSYSISSTLYAAKLKEKFDVVFVNQLSPIMMANAAIKYKKKYGTKIVMYCLDLWPESLTTGGIKQGSLIYKLFHYISKRIYKEMDNILVTSKMFKKYFEEKFGIKDARYLPQYAESIFTPKSCRKEPNANIDLMFAGNIGIAQNVETIIKAAERCKNINNLYWHIVGNGSDLENVKRLTEDLKLKNIIFHGRKTIDEMPKYYAMADAMLITMRKDNVLSMTLPGKVQTYMAAGKPILCAANGEVQNIIREARCGYAVDAQDWKELAINVQRFLKERGEVTFGKNAEKYFDEHFSKQKVLEKLESNLLETLNDETIGEDALVSISK